MDNTIYKDCERCGQDEALSGDLCDACHKATRKSDLDAANDLNEAAEIVARREGECAYVRILRHDAWCLAAIALDWTPPYF